MMNLKRRIKKHLTGQVHTCFAVTAPGWENLCQQELTVPPLALTESKVMPGGVEFQGRLHEMYAANLYLRTATRVLLRVSHLRAFSFEHLQAGVSEIPWELYLPWRVVPQVQATLHQCRLYHSGAVCQRTTHAIQSRWQQLGGRDASEDSSAQTLFIRGVKDRFSLSLDTSGSPLYMRGVKTHGGSAPLRETLGAAILMTAGYEPGMTLVDPMTGSGTFSLEAALVLSGIPPGWYRDFAFQSWPAFQEGRWRHIRRQAMESHAPQPDRPSILSMDIDGAGCRALTDRLRTHRLAPWVAVVPGDFFQLSPSEVTHHLGNSAPGLVAINPPYGLRLEDPRSCRELYGKIGRHLARHFKGWRVALIVPPQVQLKTFPIQGSLQRIFHGGLSLKLLIGRI